MIDTYSIKLIKYPYIHLIYISMQHMCDVLTINAHIFDKNTYNILLSFPNTFLDKMNYIYIQHICFFTHVLACYIVVAYTKIRVRNQ